MGLYEYARGNSLLYTANMHEYLTYSTLFLRLKLAPLQPPNSNLEALRVPVIGVGALVRAGARGAPSESNTSTLPPTGGGAARRRRRGGGGRNSAGGASAGFARSARSAGSAGRAGRGRASDAEPKHIRITIYGDVVGDASAVDTDQVGSVHVLGVP